MTHSPLQNSNFENSDDRHFRGPAPSEISIWRTAYDAYRLGLGAIFSSGVMFRYFVYGSVMSVTMAGAEFLFSFDQSGGTLDVDNNYLNALISEF